MATMKERIEAANRANLMKHRAECVDHRCTHPAHEIPEPPKRSENMHC